MRAFTYLLTFVVALQPLLAQSPAIRPRIAILVPESAPGLEAPDLQITSPTSASSYTTSESVVIIGGTVGDTVVAPMTWTSDRTTGGDITPVAGLWTIEVAGAAADAFVDDFTSVVSDDLTTHTPTPGPGSSWATARAGSGTNYCNIRSADYVQPAFAGEAARVMCRAVTASALSANYDISFRLVSSMPTSAHPNRQYGVYFSSQQTSNPTDFCAVTVGNASGSTDLRLSTSITSTGAIVTSANANPAVGNLVTVHVRGASVSVDVDGVEKIPATSISACNGSSRSAGLLFGAMISETDNTTDTTSRVDDFEIVDVGGGTSGVPILSGVNNITVEACNVAAACTQKSIRITYGTDTVAPTLSLSQPSSGGPIATTASTVTLQGLTTDTVGVTSVTCTNLSDSVAYTGVIVGDTWTCTDVAVGIGVQDIRYRACDEASNCTSLTVQVTRSASGDTTAPTITISTLSQTVTSPSIVLTGMSTDNAAVDHVTCTGDVSPGGNATGTAGASMPWSLSLSGTLVAGANVFTCTSYDTSNNPSTSATVTITYNPALSISTPGSLTLVEGQAFTYCFITAGGTAPRTVTKLTGTYPSGISLSSGCLTGTPAVASSGTYATHTYRVTDSSGGACPGSACADTSAFTITVSTGALGGTDHSYFNTMCARADIYRCYSLRDIPQLDTLISTNNSSPTKLWSYDPANDTHPERQDALKMRIRQFNPTTASVAVAMSGAVTAGTFETVQLTGSAGSFSNAAGFKIDNEIVVCMPDTTTYALPGGAAGQCRTTAAPYLLRVMRGAYGTTPAAHAVGTVVHRSSNTMVASDTPVIPVSTDGLTSNRYLAGMRVYWTQEWQGLGIPGDNSGLPGHTGEGIPNFTLHALGNSEGWTSMKWLTWSHGASTKHWETRCQASGGVAGVSKPPTWVVGDSVCAIEGGRAYDPVMPKLVAGELQTALSQNTQPVRPVTHTWTVFPSKPMYIWWYITTNTDTEATAWDNFAPLQADITDPDATTLSIDLTGLPYNTGNMFFSTSVFYGGRAMKIDSEVVKLTTCTVGTTTNPSVCTVERGAYGTTKATHTAGTQVQFTWDCVRVFVSDIDRDPTELVRACSPLAMGTSFQGALSNRLSDLTIEYGTSTSTPIQGRYLDGFPDLPIYVSDFFMLKKSGTEGAPLTDVPADWMALITGRRPTN